MDPRYGREPKGREGTTVRIPMRGRSGGPEPPPWRRWKAFAKYAIAPFAVALIAGTILLAVEYDWFNPKDTPEMAPELHDGFWQTNGESADVVGTYAEGDVWRQSDGGVFVTGFVKDTNEDGESAVLEVVPVYADGPGPPLRTMNSLESGHIVEVGLPAGPNMRGYLFPDGVEKVQVLECRSAAGAGGARQTTECGRAPAVIWPVPPRGP